MDVPSYYKATYFKAVRYYLQYSIMNNLRSNLYKPGI